MLSEKKKQLISEIDDMLKGLQSPLSKSEIDCGWTVECQLAMKKMFIDIQEKLKNEQELPTVFIAKGLDHWGVSGGQLFEKAATISNHLREA